ncbi:rubrerythrin [Rhodovulum sulfidophilum]|uniref:hypothetical protein n=1 Tax=Rhodovulum sulfidophilum TaxID=35806 RepID=UPI0012DA93A4|nr:hypothetical protein [Rhodovulum sulfidophilum]MCW2305583.1 rubrerythrin [Rhodovulum sulfidophilum]
MAYYEQDFKEVAHCGANTTINIACDDEGRKSAAFGIVSRRPGPMAAAGIYILLPHGIPVSDFKMGGIAQPFDPPLPEGCVPAILGSDSLGCWGHQCPCCSGYFRNGNHAAIYPQTCPYCGLRAAAFEFLTPAQMKFLAHLAERLKEELAAPDAKGTERQVEIDMESLVKQAADEPKPDFYYASQTQQTRYKCDQCGEFNDIRGLYGYCAACGWRNNIQMLTARFEEIRQSLNDGQAQPEAAVGQSVSAFDAACRDFANQLVRRIPMKPARKETLSRLVFHDIESDTFKRLKDIFDMNPLKGIVEKDARFIRLMMERRHIYEHNAGVIDRRYIERSGDEDAVEGNLLRENRGNTHRLIGLLARMASNVSTDFHEIFTPTEWPINSFKERQRRAER